MKFINNKYSVINGYKLLLTLTLIASVGCKKFLEIPPPKTELVSSSAFSNPSTANGVALGIYSKMVNNSSFPYRISQLTGLAGDELKSYSTVQDIATFYVNNIVSKNGYISGDFWNQAYEYIYNANSVLEGVNSSNLSLQLKNQLTGEAKFIRAFWHFYLVNLYGDIPLITSTDYTTNGSMSRTPASDVYKQIIDDLNDAQNLLNTNYVAADGLTTSNERVRPNKWAATALLARAYLFNNDFANAELESTSLINNSSYKLTSIDSVFLKNSAETIWALQPVPSGSFATPEGINYILTAIPTTGTIRNVTISSNQLNSFENNDNRKTKWIGTYNTYNFPNKYKVASATSLTEYSIVLRLAEQYLIRAEARANGAGTGLGGAIADLSSIRTRAGLSIYNGPSIKDSVLNAIYHERQVELFSEYGHRWFDLKRTGKIDQVMTAVALQKGATWSSYKKLFPIPQRELDSDPNLTQNSGYQ